MGTLEATVQEGVAGRGQLRLAGPLTAVTAPSLRSRVREAAGDGQVHMLIDLQAVTVLDAAGIAALLEARRILAVQSSGTLVLHANAVVCRALKDSGTISAFALWAGPGA